MRERCPGIPSRCTRRTTPQGALRLTDGYTCCSSSMSSRDETSSPRTSCEAGHARDRPCPSHAFGERKPASHDWAWRPRNCPLTARRGLCDRFTVPQEPSSSSWIRAVCRRTGRPASGWFIKPLRDFSGTPGNFPRRARAYTRADLGRRPPGCDRDSPTDCECHCHCSFAIASGISLAPCRPS